MVQALGEPFRGYRGANDGPRRGAPIDLGTLACRTGARALPIPTPWGVGAALCGAGDPAETLPRKEVIQPHLPVRLPCYDFVPITSPTLGSCLPCGLAHRLQVLPAFMT